jgi:hypothetical protein
MAIRQITGLKWARRLPARPACIPASRPRGSRAAGLRYERALAKSLPAALHGCWFEFEDANGHGYCSPDLILSQSNLLVILEAKLSFTLDAVPQLDFYSTIVEKALRKYTVPIIVTKYLRDVPPNFVIQSDLEYAILSARRQQLTILHWLGAAATLKMAA